MMQQDDRRRFLKSSFWPALNHPVVVAIGFSLIGILTRLPFRAQLVQEWDAGCFALAVEQYDVRLEQPHRPGTFMVYILLARGLNLFLRDPTASLVGLSVISTGLAAAGMYGLAGTWFADRRIPLVAASLLLASPIVWFYGEMPLSYVPELCWVIWIVWAATWTQRGSRLGLWTLAILMGLAGGVRPNTPFFLLPLAIWAVWKGLRSQRLQRQQVGLAGLLGLAAVAAWMIPVFNSSGGAAHYWSMIWRWLDNHRQDTNSLAEFNRNLILMAEALLLSVGLALLPLLAMLLRTRSRLWLWVQSDWRAQALLLWLIPGSLYLTGFHIQRHGHAFTLVPAWILLAAVAVVAVGDRLQRYRTWAGVALSLGVIGLNALIFPLAPGNYRTWETIRYYDTKYSERLEFIRSHFSPATTAVVAHPFYGRLPDLYLANFQARHLSRLVKNKSVVLPAPVNTLVLLDNKIYRDNDDDFQKLTLPSGAKIRYWTWASSKQMKLNQKGAKLVSPRAQTTGNQF